MLRLRLLAVPALLLVLAGCGGDEQQMQGEPGGMGAGRPDTSPGLSTADSAADILQGAGYGPTTDTAAVRDRGRDLAPVDTPR